MMRVSVTVIAALFSVARASDVVELYHRVFHPNLPAQPFLRRATVSSEGLFLSTPTLAQDLASFSEALQSLEDPSEALYQVAVAHKGDSSEAFWDFSSVKACYLGRASADTIVLHLPSERNAPPYALDYFVSPVPSDGSCPQSKSRRHRSSSKIVVAKVQSLNSTILIRSSISPPSPELRTPPPLTPEGEVVKPLPEKTFIQKYWMYIGALVLVILVGTGPDDNEHQLRRREGRQ